MNHHESGLLARKARDCEKLGGKTRVKGGFDEGKTDDAAVRLRKFVVQGLCRSSQNFF